MSIVQHNNEVTLREEAETMGDKDAGLGGGGKGVANKLRHYALVSSLHPQLSQTSPPAKG